MVKKILILTSLMLFGLIGCQQKSNIQNNDVKNRKIKVVATTGMIADMLMNIGGEKFDVKGLMGPGVDPHLYKATAGDISKLSNADIIVYNGLHLEGKMAELFEKLSSRKKTLAVAGALSEQDLLSSENYKAQHDPHIWFDVSLWIKCTKYIMEQVIVIDPENEEVYKTNGEKYISELKLLDTYAKEKLSTIKPENRVLVTAHDAFNYFGKAYDIEVKGLQGISTASEAGTADVTKLASFLVERKIPAIFVESSVPTRYMEALKEAVMSKNHKISIGGSLFSDAMGNKGTIEGTYIGMVRHNVDTITKALNRE